MEVFKSVSHLARRFCSFLVFAALLISPSLLAHAQTAGTASVQGTVTDPTGAAIPNAQVTLTNTATHTARSTVTDGSGLYSLPNVPVGPYSLTVAASGFQGYTRTGVLEVGNNISDQSARSRSAVRASILRSRPSGAALDTETSSFKQVIDQTAHHRASAERPPGDRSSILVSGGAVTAPTGDMIGSKNYKSSTVIAVAGGQGNYNNYVLDGGYHVDEFTNVNLPYPLPRRAARVLGRIQQPAGPQRRPSRLAGQRRHQLRHQPVARHASSSSCATTSSTRPTSSLPQRTR